MGLFDNIFLDQNTPTALLDQQKSEESEMPIAPKLEESTAEVTLPVEAPKVEAQAVSELPTFEVEATSSPVIPAISQEAPMSSDVSFDIGGDMDLFGTQETMPEAKSPEELQGDSLIISNNSTPEPSIALVQSATAVGGLMIIDENTTTETTPAQSGETMATGSDISAQGVIEEVHIEMPVEEVKTQAEEVSPISLITEELPKAEETTTVEEGHITTIDPMADTSNLFGFMNDTPKDTIVQGVIEEVHTPTVEVNLFESSPAETTKEVSPTTEVILQAEETTPTLESHAAITSNTDEHKVNMMVGGFIDELERERSHLQAIDELYTFKMQDIARRKAELEEEYQAKIKILDQEATTLLEEKSGKNKELNHLNELIATLRVKAES